MNKFTQLLCAAALCAGGMASASNPAAEVRAVWLTTNSGMDWPGGTYTESAQKRKLTDMLDKLREANFNTIIFQAQVKGDVAWKSVYQPPIVSLTGNGSKSLSYDLCGFVIDECHKRNMECHAWIVPYRIGTENEAKRYDSNAVKHPSRTHADLVVTYENAYYLDPGNPATTDYLVDVYRELVTNYNFDGINFDYTRYPGSNFADGDSYRRYNPDGLSRDDWRRDNINRFVAAVYAMVKEIKPWMKVGAAPIGTYKNVPGYGNMTAYGSVYQDAAQWMQSGNHDLLIPQMYWNERYGFTPNMQTWVDNCAGRQIVVGLAPYKMVDGSNNWEYTVVTDQIEKQRANPGTCGVCFFRTLHVTGGDAKVRQLYNALQTDYFSTPAKIPHMPYGIVSLPGAPTAVERIGNTISWVPSDAFDSESPIKAYVVYRKKNGKVDTDDASTIVAIVNTCSLDLPAGEPDGADYAVTAIDRNNCESMPSGVAGVAAVGVSPTTIAAAAHAVKVTCAGGIGRVTVCDMAGRTVACIDAGGVSAATVDMGPAARGIYVVRVATARGPVTARVAI